MRNILHSDMNNFYASVECMLNPSLKGKPVAVCGSVEERHGIVLAKNYPAKAYGVQTGEAVWQAQHKCPGLVIVPPHYDEYIKYSKLAREVYSRYTNQVEPYGMDECWLDISGYKSRNPEAVAYEIKETMKEELGLTVSVGVSFNKIFAKLEAVAYEIKETMKEELGLTVSVGVSFNKIFAKLGSDMKKPDAVTVIPKDSFKEKIWHLPASDLLFVGRATQRTLDRFCIRTIGDLANTAPEFLKSYLGVHGLKLWQYANGLDNSPVMYEDYRPVVKSVGHGTTTKADLTSNEEVWITILELSQGIGHRLKKLGMNCMGISICIRNEDLMHKEWQQKLNFATQSPFVIAKLAYTLFLQKYVWNKNIRSVTVRAINLISDSAPMQLDLFVDQDSMIRQTKIRMMTFTILTLKQYARVAAA